MKEASRQEKFELAASYRDQIFALEKIAEKQVAVTHNLEDADVISVRLYDKRTLQARLVGRDPLTDIALLKIDANQLAALRRRRPKGDLRWLWRARRMFPS